MSTEGWELMVSGQACRTSERPGAADNRPQVALEVAFAVADTSDSVPVISARARASLG